MVVTVHQKRKIARFIYLLKGTCIRRAADGSNQFIVSNIITSIIILYFTDHQVNTLTELAAKCVASYIPFELVEHVFPPVPEQLQLRIAFWSFPDNEEDIRLYSCLANSSADEFHRGDQLYKNRSVKEPLQIGKPISFGERSFLIDF